MKRLLAFWALAGLFLLGAQPASAQSESCEKCKFLRCLKSSVERKQNLVKVYQGILNFWAPHSMYDTDAPVSAMDFSTLAEPKRSQFFSVVIHQLSQYDTMLESRTAAVPAPEGCGYPADAVEIEVETDALETCTTKKLAEVQAMQPCKELAALITAHEALHSKECRQRQKPERAYWPLVYVDPQGKRHERFLPPKILTPVGIAAEEIAAYQLEIAGLTQIIEKLEKKCGKLSFKDVTIDCIIRNPECTMRLGQKLAGSVCGDPLKETWTITPHYFSEGCGVRSGDTKYDKPFDNDCVLAGSNEEKRRATIYANAREKGSGGWMCVYSEDPRPQITIRSFQAPSCEGEAEQTITVDAEVSQKCDESSQPPPTPPTRPNS